MAERVERAVDDDRLCIAPAGDVVEVVVDEGVDAQGELGGLVVGRQQRAGLVGAEPVPPQVDHPARVRVADRRPRGRRVGRQLGALALHAAQHGVDQPVSRARLGQLDRLADRRVGGHPVEEQQLEEAELQRRADARLERAIDVARDDVVERQAALDGAEGQLLGQRAIARLEAAGLAVQRPIGVGALGQRAQHDGVRGAAGGAEGGERHRAHGSAPPADAASGASPRTRRPSFPHSP